MVYNILYIFCIIFLFINLYNNDLNNNKNTVYLYSSIIILVLIYISLDKIPKLENFSVYDNNTNLLSLLKNDVVEEEVVEDYNDTVSLKSYKNRYLSVDSNGDLSWNIQLVNDMEEFEMKEISKNVISLKGNNGKYLSTRCDGFVSCDKDKVTDTEKFTIQMHNGYYSLLSYYKTYLGIDEKNNIQSKSKVITVNEKIYISRKSKLIKAQITEITENKLNIDSHLKQVKYGDIIYLQCNALDNRFLTGGRGKFVIPDDAKQIRPDLPKDTLVILSDTAYSGNGITGGNRQFIKDSESDLTNINNRNWYHSCQNGFDQGFNAKYWHFPNVNNFSSIKPEQLINPDKSEIVRNQDLNWNWRHSKILNFSQGDRVILSIDCILKVEKSKSYEFSAYYDDDIKVYLNNKLIINEWNGGQSFSYSWTDGWRRHKMSSSIYLNRGFYPLKIYFCEKTGGALIRLRWNKDRYFVPISRNDLILTKHNNSNCTKNIEIVQDNMLVGLYYNFDFKSSEKALKLHENDDDYKQFGTIPNIVLKTKGSYNLDNPDIKLKSGDDLAARLGSIKIIKLSNFRTIVSDHGGMNQQVFTTNESGKEIEWIIRSEVGGHKRNSLDKKNGMPVKYNDIVYLQSNSLDNRYLSGGIVDNQQLPYSNNYNETVATVGNHYNPKYLAWIIKSDLNSGSEDYLKKINVRYNQRIYLQSELITDRFLCGGRHGFVFDNPNEIHSNVYMTSHREGVNETSWIIKDKKGNGKCLRTNEWPLWENQPGIIGVSNWKNMFTASSCKNYSPYSGNQRKPINSTSNDTHYGESCIDNNNSDNIHSSWKVLKKYSGWTTGSGSCNNEFLVINLGTEQYVDKAILYPTYEGHIKFFSIKLAKKDGVFLDFGKRFETNFLNSWVKNNTEIYITNSISKKTWDFKCLEGEIKNCSNLNIEEGPIVVGNKLDATRVSEKFKLKIFNIQNKNIVAIQTHNDVYLKANSDKKTIGFSVLSSGTSLPFLWVEERFILEHFNGFIAIKTHYGTYLAMSNLYGRKRIVQKAIAKPDDECLFNFNRTNGMKLEKQFEFKIKSVFQYIKILPISSEKKCSLRLDLYDQYGTNILDNLTKNIHQNVKSSSCFNYKNGKISKFPMGESCSSGNYTTGKIERNSFGGWMQGSEDDSPFIIIDTLKEQFIKGGIIYNRDDEDEMRDDTCDSCSNYVKNFNVELAGNNKIFRLHSKHETKVTETGEKFNEQIGKNGRYRFNIMKDNIRYIKLILTKCNNNCSMRLDIY